MNERFMFRGKRKDNGEWIQGSLLCFHANRFGIWHEDKQTYMCFDVEPATVGQCTDLRDDSEKLIFEGDILRLTNEQDEVFIVTVVFGNPNGRYSWGWQLSFHHPNGCDNDILLWVETELPDMKCEIIGNIHDAPGADEAALRKEPTMHEADTV